MTLTTPRLVLPYPEPNDTVDVPRDVTALANRLDAIAARQPGAPLAAQPVLDVGLVGQIRAGRQLAPVDFTALGLAAPIGLWNLSTVNDSSGNGRNLTNKGAVPFGVGINGLAATAAQFAGSTAQALYIADTGVADPFRIATGSWGCWFKTAKRATSQYAMSKLLTTGNQRAFAIQVTAGNTVGGYASVDGIVSTGPVGVSDVADDRWHSAVCTVDGTTTRLYVDGALEAVSSLAGGLFAGSAALNIGAWGADASLAANEPFYGRVDEAFVTADILSEDQIRNLYCARITHGYAATPARANINVTRRRRGGAWAVADFPTQPLRLHNFTQPSPLVDQGSNNQVLIANQGTGFITTSGISGADGAAGAGGAAASLTGAHAGMSATDAGLPAALTARSYGLWYKTTALVSAGVMGWGTLATGDARLISTTTGLLIANSGADSITSPYVADGQWHLVVVAEDNAAGDGVKRKLYVDGRLVGGSTVMNALTLLGANRFRIGANPDGTSPWAGQADGAFVCGYALTATDIAALYAKGSQALAPSPKNAGDHAEAMDATSVLALFDTLDTTALVDMGVQA